MSGSKVGVADASVRVRPFFGILEQGVLHHKVFGRSCFSAALFRSLARTCRLACSSCFCVSLGAVGGQTRNINQIDKY